MKIEIPTHLSDNELVASLKGLLGREREATAQVVAHLAVMDMRDVHLREGYTSLYAYSRAVLGLSEWEAYNRIEVARDALRFPAILDLLAEGSVGLTTVKLLSSHLTPDNHLDVLASARGKSKLEVQEIVARLAPRPDVPCSVRRLQGSRPEVLTATSGSPATTEAGPGDTSPAPLGSPAVPAPAPAATSAMAPLATVKPLSPDRYKLQLTISGATLEKLQLAKDMLAHAVPSGGEEAVLDRALDALLADLTRKKFAQTSKPRSPQAAKPGSRHITATSADSWSSTMSIRMPWAARPPSTGSSCGAGTTTITRAGCTSAGGVGVANLFRNKLALGATDSTIRPIQAL
jgi:hypothetical protein